MYQSLFIFSPIEQHLDRVQLGAIMNKVGIELYIEEFFLLETGGKAVLVIKWQMNHLNSVAFCEK